MNRRVVRALVFLLSAACIAGCARGLAINTDPPGAHLRLVEKYGEDSFDLGFSPVTTKVVAADEYIIIVEKLGYLTLKRRIRIGERSRYDFELVPVYDLSIDTDPPGAGLFMEDKGSGRKFNLGRAPARYSVEGKGPYVVTATLDGYETAVEELETVPGVRAFATTIRLTLKQPETPE